jgi:PTH1 family peptidyl-tRNA hydrolase
LLVVYDDADLELGRLRIRPRGTAGGHNGLQSVIDELGTTEIPRLRLGVCGAGRPSRALADYVLTAFEADEVPAAERLVQAAVEAVGDVLEGGLVAAMNRYNAPRLTPAGSRGGGVRAVLEFGAFR